MHLDPPSPSSAGRPRSYLKTLGGKQQGVLNLKLRFTPAEGFELSNAAGSPSSSKGNQESARASDPWGAEARFGRGQEGPKDKGERPGSLASSRLHAGEQERWAAALLGCCTAALPLGKGKGASRVEAYWRLAISPLGALAGLAASPPPTLARS
jgi:hypothetical protein